MDRIVAAHGLLAFSLVVSTARADAIAISDGFCPAGLDHSVQHHGDGCWPRACTSDVQCGEGAACHAIAECVVQESRNSLDGRVLLPEPVIVDVAQGLCRSDGTCPAGRCVTRRQCEPVASTEGWDATNRRWNGTFLTHEPGHGCSIGARAGGAPGGVSTLVLALAAFRRRRQARGGSSAICAVNVRTPEAPSRSK